MLVRIKLMCISFTGICKQNRNMEQQNEICLLVEKEAPSQRNTHETSNNNLANGSIFISYLF